MAGKELPKKKPLAVGKSREGGPLQGLFLKFRDEALARGHSPTTLRSMACDVRKLEAFMAEAKMADVSVFGPRRLGEFQAWLADGYRTSRKGMAGKKIGISARANSIRNAKTFLRWAYRAGHLPNDLSTHLQAPRLPKRLPSGIPTAREVALLVRGQRARGDPVGLRNASVVSLLFASGLRREELANLRMEDVDLEDRIVRVRRGKGGRGRSVPFAPWARDVLAQYLRDGRPGMLTKPVESLFVTSTGKPFSPDDVNKAMVSASAEAGIGRTISPHPLRHAFCMALLKGGASLRAVSELAGHANVSATMRYTRLTVDDLRQVVRRSHPRGR